MKEKIEHHLVPLLASLPNVAALTLDGLYFGNNGVICYILDARQAVTGPRLSKLTSCTVDCSSVGRMRARGTCHLVQIPSLRNISFHNLEMSPKPGPHTDCPAESLEPLSSLQLSRCSLPEEGFGALLRTRRLRTLSLCDNDYGTDKLSEDLEQALRVLRRYTWGLEGLEVRHWKQSIFGNLKFAGLSELPELRALIVDYKSGALRGITQDRLRATLPPNVESVQFRFRRADLAPRRPPPDPWKELDELLCSLVVYKDTLTPKLRLIRVDVAEFAHQDEMSPRLQEAAELQGVDVKYKAEYDLMRQLDLRG